MAYTVNILGIAPYEDLKNRLNKVAAEFDHIHFECYVGDLEEGLKIVKKNEHYFDIVISRGGTAKMIEQTSSLPVIEIEISILDVLRVIKLVDLYDEKHAYVGFENITKQAITLSEILQLDLDTVTINNSQETVEIIETLKQHDYSLIIGDMITTKMAHQYDINAVLVESGKESIKEAFQKAFTLGRILSAPNNQLKRNQMIHDNLHTTVLQFDQNYHLVFHNGSLLHKTFLNRLQQLIQQTVFANDTIVYFWENYYNKTYSIGIVKNMDLYSCFLKEVSDELSRFNLVKNLETMPLIKEQLGNSSIFIGDTINTVSKALTSSAQLFIEGERGTGKNKMLYYLAKKTTTEKKWLIDFSNRESIINLEALFNSPSSILYDQNVTFFIKGIDYLQEEELKVLIDFVETSSSKSTQWVFFREINHDKINRQNKKLLLNSLDIIPITLQPLRERKDDLNSLLSLYLYLYNKQFNKNILGFEPDALKIIDDYMWPGNIRQIKRIIKKLVINNKQAFISPQSIEEAILADEEFISEIHPEKTDLLDFFQKHNLAEINNIAANEVLKNNNGNKTKTAEQLGISRSTLWRMLQ